MSSLRRETLAEHPAPPTTPLEALAHVLAIYAEVPDDRVVIDATRNIYPEAPWTGLTFGDLRALLSEHAHELAEELRTRFDVKARAEHQWADGWMSAADYIDPQKEGQ